MTTLAENITGTSGKKGVITYLVTSIAIIFLMIILGIIMLLNQGKVIQISPNLFYEIMTVHGTGMIGAAAMAATSIMWYFLSKYVKLSTRIFITNLVLSIIGVVLILASVFLFNFAGAWTFLYPLPAKSVGVWGVGGAALFLIGLLILGTGFILQYLDVARAIIAKYGSLGNALGWPQIIGKVKGYGPPTTVVASTMVLLANLTALLTGATILVLSIINLYFPSFTIDPLLAKNLTYGFGHIFANVIIYMAVIAVYEVLSAYTKRPWKSNKVFLIAWNFSTINTIIIYPHHLLMDFAMPKWALILGQVMSYANGLPVLVVTAYGALMIVYKSGIKWNMAAGFMFLSMFGWVAGVVPAIIDATIVVNQVMHNTKWVPGHFHMYMGIGAVAMLFGFMYYLRKEEGNESDNLLDRISFWVYAVFLLGLSGTFLYSGKLSAPRRWAEHLPEWVPMDQLGALFGVFIALAVLVFFLRFLGSIKAINNTQKQTIGTGVNA